MRSAIIRFFHRPAVRFGLTRDGSGRFRNPRFISFIAQNNRKTLNTDFQDAVLQGRRMLRFALVAGLVASCAWIVLESANAISMF